MDLIWWWQTLEWAGLWDRFHFPFARTTQNSHSRSCLTVDRNWFIVPKRMQDSIKIVQAISGVFSSVQLYVLIASNSRFCSKEFHILLLLISKVHYCPLLRAAITTYCTNVFGERQVKSFMTGQLLCFLDKTAKVLDTPFSVPHEHEIIGSVSTCHFMLT